MDVTHDDASSGDAGPELDLTPRTPPAPRQRRRWPYVAVVVVIVAAVGFVLTRAIGDATVFFYNADEAVAERSEIGDRRFRLQGTVVPDTTERTTEGVEFVVAFNGVTVPVHHVGDPPELFQDSIPVVLEGRWDAADAEVFASDRILVKHDEVYDADNPDRLVEAEQGGQVPVGAGSS